MIIILSPAKRLNFKEPGPTNISSMPEYGDEAKKIASVLASYSPQDLKSLLGVSAKLAYESYEKFQQWEFSSDMSRSKQAILSYQGDVYNGLRADELDHASLEWAQEHLRILSGLYGVLRPLDLIMPYRLEFATKLNIEGYKELYSFWYEHIDRSLHSLKRSEGSGVLINLASAEYFKSFDATKLGFDVITPVFKEYRNGEYKFLSMYGKKARGMMSRYIIENKLSDPEQIKLFDSDGYLFNAPLSKDKQWVFTR